MEIYSYLKRYINKVEHQCITEHLWFDRVSMEDIDKAEMLCNIKFPNELVNFWLAIGQGQIEDSKKDGCENYILPPTYISNIIVDPENAEWCYYADDSNQEMLEKGYFPFFDIQQSEYFLWMKAGSDSVYDPSEIKIEEHFEDFIYNLCHIHPGYYWKKICSEENWKKEGYNIPEVDTNWYLGRHKR